MSYYIKPSSGGFAVFSGLPENEPYTVCLTWCFTRRGARAWVKRRIRNDNAEPEVFR